MVEILSDADLQKVLTEELMRFSSNKENKGMNI
jgi:hypothetical protein